MLINTTITVLNHLIIMALLKSKDYLCPVQRHNISQVNHWLNLKRMNESEGIFF